jgi:nucleoside-diphosphate-sugar epimerase
LEIQIKFNLIIIANIRRSSTLNFSLSFMFKCIRFQINIKFKIKQDMQTILGANGTIGSVLAKELSSYTNKIRLVSRNPRKVNETDELFQADLSQPGLVDKAVEGSDVVYLVVGFEYKLSIWEKNWPKLMRATIDACIKHKARLVFFDNVYMYDINAIPHMTEDSPINPPSKKGAVRKQIAQMILDEVKAGRIMALIARSADFYGPGNDKSFLMEVVYKNFKKGKRANWIKSIDKKHSFTFTPDAAKATALLGNTNDAYNQVWHLPTDKNQLTGKEIVDLFAREMNARNKVSVLPTWFIKILGLFIPFMKEMPEMMYQYDRDYFFDSSKFDKRFNFKTTTYEEGVKIIVAGT